MSLIRTPALILHAFPYGDTSRILRLLTPEYGLRSVIAKGAMSPRSRFGGLLEPFTEGEVQFNLRPGRDLFVLSGFSLLRARQAIGRDFDAFTGASLIAEVMLRFGTEEAAPELYQAVSDAFDRLMGQGARPGASSPSAGIPSPGPVTPPANALDLSAAALWNLTALLGFRPEMGSCVHCGETLGDNEVTRFDAMAGGARCSACGGSGAPLSPELRREVDRMAETAAGQPPPAERRRHAELLHAFLSAHLFQGQSLRSLRLFLDQFG
ncbi:MAG: DNA repair protein RecO [Gemmatimonadota bacterium]|jgi:DNA repair protein RecO (recombination protein O)|nr:DNA repair protein RecO [Gemmatimonadota bacterium]